MKVLVTGVTGLIGTELSRVLSEAGHTVSGLSRNPTAAHRRAPWLDQTFGWDAMASPPPLEALSGADAVIHLAGERITVRPTAANKRAVLESRRTGTRHLVEGLSLATPRPRVLMSSSAVGYYGDHGDADVLEETPPASQHFLAQVCVAWEHEAAPARDLGLRVAVLRIGLVLASGGGALAPLVLLARLGLGGPLGSGKQWWPWIHLDDLVGLIKHALENDIQGVFNASSARARTPAGVRSRPGPRASPPRVRSGARPGPQAHARRDGPRGALEPAGHPPASPRVRLPVPVPRARARLAGYPLLEARDRRGAVKRVSRVRRGHPSTPGTMKCPALGSGSPESDSRDTCSWNSR